MTSISATSNSNYLSPLQLLQDELQSEVNSGAVSSSDQSALSSALTDINSSLQSGSASASAEQHQLHRRPAICKSKINSLIASEVSSGKLTSDQATELQGVFQAAFANGPGAPASRRPGCPNSSAAVRRLRRTASGPGGAGGVHHGHHGGHWRVRQLAPTVRRRPAARAVHRAPAHPTMSCSSFSNRCRNSLSSSSSSAYSATGTSDAGSTSSRLQPRF